MIIIQYITIIIIYTRDDVVITVIVDKLKTHHSI